jgi:hypothetical protein
VSRIVVYDSGRAPLEASRIVLFNGARAPLNWSRAYQYDEAGAPLLIFSPIAVIPFTVNARAALPATAAAAILFYSNGTEQYQNNANPDGVTLGNWNQAGNGANYDIEATLVSGTAPSSGALNTWISLAASPNFAEWTLANDSGLGNTLSCVLEIHIRLHSSGAVVATGNVGLTALSSGST